MLKDYESIMAGGVMGKIHSHHIYIFRSSTILCTHNFLFPIHRGLAIEYINYLNNIILHSSSMYFSLIEFLPFVFHIFFILWFYSHFC